MGKTGRGSDLSVSCKAFGGAVGRSTRSSRSESLWQVHHLPTIGLPGAQGSSAIHLQAESSLGISEGPDREQRCPHACSKQC